MLVFQNGFRVERLLFSFLLRGSFFVFDKVFTVQNYLCRLFTGKCDPIARHKTIVFFLNLRYSNSRTRRSSADKTNTLTTIFEKTSMKYLNSVLETVGNTPLIRLHRVVSDIPALVLAKVETFNPGLKTIINNFFLKKNMFNYV